MNMTNLGDMAQTRMLGRRHAELKLKIGQLTQELTTGRTSDVGKRLAGDFSYVSDLERNLRSLAGYRSAIEEADTFMRAQQAAMAKVQSAGSDLAAQLIVSGASNIPKVVENAASLAAQTLDAVISGLNSQVAGRSVFAGNTSDKVPVVDATTLLNHVKSAVSGALTATDVQAAARIWFDDPAGFSTLAYQGSDTSLSRLSLGGGEAIDAHTRADDIALREVLMQTTLAALATDPDLNLSPENQITLIQDAGTGLLAANDKLTGLRAEIGIAEQQVEASKVQNEAATATAEMAKSKLLGIDPYESATRLEEVQFQLESLYSLTVRSSRLSLLSYMR